MLKALLDLLLPVTCPVCGMEIGDRTARLDEKCWSKITFITPPFCELCNMPLISTHARNPQRVCFGCQKDPPPWKEARAVFLFTGAGRQLVLRYKYADRTDCTGFLAGLLHKASKDMLGSVDLIVPVPIARMRLFWRRYNQSALLASRLAKLAGKEWAPVLKTTRRTKDQILLSKNKRRTNVRGAFTATENLANKRILLVDDVRTSGATAAECSKVLLKSGAESVRVATLAWVSMGR